MNSQDHLPIRTAVALLALPDLEGWQSGLLHRSLKPYKSLDASDLYKSTQRLFVPAQVAREFARIRTTKLLDVFKALTDKRSRILRPSVGRYPLLEGLSEYSEVINIEKELGKQVKAYQDALGKLLDAIRRWGWNDPVATIYRTIFSSDTVRMPSFDKTEIETELSYRTTHKIPPGYKDACREGRGSSQ